MCVEILFTFTKTKSRFASWTSSSYNKIFRHNSFVHHWYRMPFGPSLPYLPINSSDTFHDGKPVLCYHCSSFSNIETLPIELIECGRSCEFDLPLFILLLLLLLLLLLSLVNSVELKCVSWFKSSQFLLLEFLWKV